MKPTLTLSLVAVVCALRLTPLSAGVQPPRWAETLRTVYFSAVDAQGEPVTDLLASDLTVKEDGKDRTVTSLQPATGPFQVSILVDDGGSGSFRTGVAQFLDNTLSHGEFAISLLSPQPIKLADYLTDVDGLKAAVAKLVQRGRVQSDSDQLIEAVSWAAKELQKRKARRPVILALTNGGEPRASEVGDAILDDLRDSRASLHVVFVNGVVFGKVLSQGPKQSGGLLQNAAGSRAVDDAVLKVAASLKHQYVATYVLPNGTKPNERLQLATTRKDIKLIAPERIPVK